jgi:hypothetical protein
MSDLSNYMEIRARQDREGHSAAFRMSVVVESYLDHPAGHARLREIVSKWRAKDAEYEAAARRALEEELESSSWTELAAAAIREISSSPGKRPVVLEGRPKDAPSGWKPVRLLVDPGDATADEIAEYLAAVSQLSSLKGEGRLVWKVVQ